MKVEPVKAIQPTQLNRYKPKTIDLDTYRKIKAEVKEHQPDVLGAFDALDYLFDRIAPWVIGGAVAYILAQMVRWWLG